MIHGRLKVLGYASVSRGAYANFSDYKKARDDADAFVLELLAEISRQTGKPETYPPQGIVEATPPTALGELPVWLGLKRLAAWLESGELPLSQDAPLDPTDDERLRPYLSGKSTPVRFAHLLLHAESSGFFLPLAFPRPFWIAAHQCSVGSAPALQKELRVLSEALAAHEDRWPQERALAARLEALCDRAGEERLAIELSNEGAE